MNSSYARVRYSAGEACATRGQEAVVGGIWKAILGSFGVRKRADAVVLANVRWSAGQRCRENTVGGLVGWAQLKFSSASDVDGILCGQPILRTGSAVFVDDVLGKKIVHRFAVLRFVSCEDMVEAAVFADDNNHVLDG